MKTFAPPPRRLRILIVEDKIATARLLSYDLGRAFQKSEIEIAGTVDEGHAMREKSLAVGKPYDVAILDFKLPIHHEGQHPESDFSLGRAFRDFSSETLIAHITGHGKDPEIQEFLRHGDTLAEAGRLFIAKEEGWIKQLIRELTRALHTRRIRRRFEELFCPQREMGLHRSMRRNCAMGRSDRVRTLAITTLCDEASRHWVFLTESLQRDLARTLGHVQDAKGNHFVGVVETDPKEDEEEVEL